MLQIPVNEDGCYDKEKLQKIRDDRGYNYEDVVDCSPTTLPNYDDKVCHFHLHRAKLDCCPLHRAKLNCCPY